MKFIKQKTQAGFSLTEVMVAAAILGAMALAGSKLMVSQTKSMKTIESKSEVNGIINDIRTILADSASCTATFGGNNAKDTPAGTVSQITQVTPGGNRTRFQANADWRQGNAYGNGNVRILSFALSDANTDPGVEVTAVAGLPATGVTELLITFSFGEGRVVGSDTAQKRIRLNVTTEVGNTTVASCSSATVDNSINDATLSCTAIGGTYDQSTERCNLVAYPSTPPSSSNAVSTQYLSDWMTDLDARYVNVTGDTMTGNLTMDSGADIVMNNGSSLSLTDGTISLTSDRRLKKDIRDLPRGTLGKIRKMRPVSYRWKSNNEIHYGVIAQEMAKVYPDLVTNVGPGDTIGVNYIELIPVLIKGIREMDEENRELKKSLKKTDREIQMLKKIICEREVDSEVCRTERKR
ncbi:MAG: tail fiber domain-containing protein [Bacteriovoracia bacterium]